MKLLDSTPTLYSKERAEEIARVLNGSCDDDWTYEADHDPKGTGYSKVKIFDEDGEFVGFMTGS